MGRDKKKPAPPAAAAPAPTAAAGKKTGAKAAAPAAAAPSGKGAKTAGAGAGATSSASTSSGKPGGAVGKAGTGTTAASATAGGAAPLSGAGGALGTAGGAPGPRPRSPALAGWTGKVPMTMLNEWCQKNKYQRPDYRHRRGGTMYVYEPPPAPVEAKPSKAHPTKGAKRLAREAEAAQAAQCAATDSPDATTSTAESATSTAATASSTTAGCASDPATKIPEHRFTIVLVPQDPKHQADPDKRMEVECRFGCDDINDAKHIAAVCALHRIDPNVPRYRVLPPYFRPLWHTLCERHDEQLAHEKQRQEREAIKQAQKEQRDEKQRRIERLTMKVIMSTNGVSLLQSVLQHLHQQRAALRQPSSAADTSLAINHPSWQAIEKRLRSFGFDRNQARLALEYAAQPSAAPSVTLEQCLDWLCLFLPEDDLPERFRAGKGNFEVGNLALTESATSTSSAASHSRPDLALNAEPSGASAAELEALSDTGRLLYDAGYTLSSINDACATAATRTEPLVHLLTPVFVREFPNVIQTADDDEQAQSLIDDELTVLQAMFDEHELEVSVRERHCGSCNIVAVIRVAIGSATNGATEPRLEFHLSRAYPQQPPAMLLHDTSLPRTTKHYILSQLVAELPASLGEPMLYMLSSAAKERYHQWIAEADDLHDQVPQSGARMVATVPQHQHHQQQQQPSQPAGSTISGTMAHETGHKAAGRKRKPTKHSSGTSGGGSSSREQFDRAPKPRSKHEEQAECEALRQEYLEMRVTDTWKTRFAKRTELPIYKLHQDIVDISCKNRVVIVTGSTGSGKSTQVAQFLLDHHVLFGNGASTSILITQPRKISAISLAERVAWERGETVGSTVGYHVRLQRKASAKTKLLFCTTGILLRLLHGNPLLHGVSHVVVDEVHERSIDCDFLLLLLRRIMRKNTAVRVVLMSATVDAELFSNYFGGVPIVAVPGRTFPVLSYYLDDMKSSPDEHLVTIAKRLAGDDASTTTSKRPKYLVEQQLYEAIVSLIWYIIEDLEAFEQQQQQPPRGSKGRRGGASDSSGSGSILVFLPGMKEILQVMELLRSDERAARRLLVLPLHSSVAIDQQQRVFDRAPPGITKVVLSTNIAETSVTIEDVVYVIDSGKQNRMAYDAETRTLRLEQCDIARSSAKQRVGRAGRVREGFAYCLYTKEHFGRVMRATEEAEIHCTPLHQLYLQAKALITRRQPAHEARGRHHHHHEHDAEQDAAAFLAEAIEPPPLPAVRDAESFLVNIGALTRVGPSLHLTALGFHLAALPIDVQLGKMLLYAAVLRCLPHALTIAAFLSSQSPFVAPPDQRQAANAAHKRFAAARSDHFRFLSVYAAFEAAGNQRKQREFCKANWLSYAALTTIRDLRQQLAELVAEIGFDEDDEHTVPPADEHQHAANDVHFAAELAELFRDSGTTLSPEVTSSVPNVAAVRRMKVLYAAICAGMYPNVVQVEHPERKYHQVLGSGTVPLPTDPRSLRFWDGTNFSGSFASLQPVSLHPKSANFSIGDYESLWLVYYQKRKLGGGGGGARTSIIDCTMVFPYALLLFGGELTVQHEDSTITVGGWIRFQAAPQIATLVKGIRAEIEELFATKIADPTVSIANHPLVLLVIRLLQTDGLI